MRTRLFLLVVCLASLSLHAQQPFELPANADVQVLWNAYERSIYDASVYTPWHVRPLRPLTPDEKGNVLVATLTSKDGKPGDTITAGQFGMWVTGVPEVQDICRGFKGDVQMQLRELLGLPPDAATTRFLVLTVAASDVFRPAPDDTITTRYPCTIPSGSSIPANCGNTFPSTTTPAHYQWMAVEVFYLHTIPNGYPWTHLGYTYNWTPGADRYGASEYVIRGGATATIVENVPALQYCEPTPAAAPPYRTPPPPPAPSP